MKRKFGIKKGDTVLIISGKDRGKKGKVLEVNPKSGRVVVEGANKAFRHVRPKKQGEKGQRIEINLPMDISNALVVCGKCGKSTRIKSKKIESGRTRVCRKCNEVL